MRRGGLSTLPLWASARRAAVLHRRCDQLYWSASIVGRSHGGPAQLYSQRSSSIASPMRSSYTGPRVRFAPTATYGPNYTLLQYDATAMHQGPALALVVKQVLSVCKDQDITLMFSKRFNDVRSNIAVINVSLKLYGRQNYWPQLCQ